MDIYGSCYRLSNTWLTRIIAYCLDVADLFLMPLEIVNICLTYWSLHWFLYGISDFLLCRSEWPDILLASAIQLFNVEITFKHAFSTQLIFGIWLVCQLNEEVLEGLQICFRFPDLANWPIVFCWKCFQDTIDICQCRQDKMGERKTAFSGSIKLPSHTYSQNRAAKSPHALYIWSQRGSELPG